MAVTTLNADATQSLGTAVNNSGTLNTKSSYAEFTSSAAVDVQALIVSNVAGTAPSDFMYDIATGAAASETDVIANAPGFRPSIFPACTHVFPLKIASGTRISGRFQSRTSTTQTWRPVIYLLSGITVPFSNCSSSVTYGANTATSGGTSIEPGGSLNTKGSYVEITASTTDDIDWLAILPGNANNTARTNAGWLMDIATGAGGSESIQIADVQFIGGSSSGSFITPTGGYTFPITIASGTRIAVRAQCNINDATDRLIDIILIGFNGAAAAGGGGGAHFSASFGG